MSEHNDTLAAKVMKPIGSSKLGEASWYRNADGNYTIAAVVVGIACIFVAIYIVH